MIDKAALVSIELNLEECIQRAFSEAGIAHRVIGFQQLFGDGSDRKFYRVRTETRSYILLVSPRIKVDGIDEVDSYHSIGRHLFQRGIPIPEFYWADTTEGCFLMEDVGDCHFQNLVTRGRLCTRSLYLDALQLLVQFHKQGREGFSAAYCFDSSAYDPPFVYARELEYFRTAFLGRFAGLEVSGEALSGDFSRLAEAAGAFDGTTVIHRDFQSRNLMAHRGRLRLIDFQGMRFGPPAYDLASLVIDPYVALSPDMQEEIVALYWTAASRFLRCTARSFRESYKAVRLSRNLQVLGAYGFLSLVKGKMHFLEFVPGAWDQLSRWVGEHCRGEYPVLEGIIDRLNRGERIRERLRRAQAAGLES